MIDLSGLLGQLSSLLQTDLKPDDNNCCLVSFPDGIQIQMEPADGDEDSLAVVTLLGEVPPGRYREDLFLAALKSNGQAHQRCGTLAYSIEQDQLVLFDFIPEESANGDVLTEYLERFREKAVIWKSALEDATIPVIEDEGSTPGGGGLFGLRP